MPLNSVLFPGAPASLYIHEERYRRMLAECLAEDGVFGVALLKSGKEVGGPGIPHEVGTLARIAQVTKLPDDSSIVLAMGVQRFRIGSIAQFSPVVEADVQVLADDQEPMSAGAATLTEARERMGELLSLILKTMGQDEVEPPIPEDPAVLSAAPPQEARHYCRAGGRRPTFAKASVAKQECRRSCWGGDCRRLPFARR